MAIKRRMEVTYVTDRGIEMQLSDMEDAHIINAIAHHKKQIQVLEESPVKSTSILFRISALNDTVASLYYELADRNPEETDHD